MLYYLLMLCLNNCHNGFQRLTTNMCIPSLEFGIIYNEHNTWNPHSNSMHLEVDSCSAVFAAGFLCKTKVLLIWCSYMRNLSNFDSSTKTNILLKEKINSAGLYIITNFSYDCTFYINWRQCPKIWEGKLSHTRTVVRGAMAKPYTMLLDCYNRETFNGLY